MSSGLLRNSFSNFFAGVIPAIATLITVPVVVSHLGPVQYGIFLLLTSIVGYFSVLDINASAGSMKYLAEYHAQGESTLAAQVITCGALIYLVIGIVGAMALFGGAGWVLDRFFEVPAALRATTVHALQIGAVAFIFGQMQAYLTSVPQALLRYDISARYESIFGVLVSVSTMAVVLAGGDLISIMLARLAISMANCGLLIAAIRTLVPHFEFRLPPRSMVRSVLAFSGYAYLSRLATVTYQNADKLIVGSLVGMRAVAMFSVPFLLANRVFGMVFRLGHAMFPLASALSSQGRQQELRDTYLLATRYLVYLNACLCVILCMLSRELLHYWAGHVFGPSAALVLNLVALTVFMDSMTNLPSLVNDGLGKPHNTGLFAMARTTIGVILVFMLVQRWGYIGAAWAQLATSSVMASAFLWYIHLRIMPVSLMTTVKSAYLPAVAVIALFVPLAILRSGSDPFAPLHLAVFASLIMLVLAAVGWHWVLRAEARALVIARLLPRRLKSLVR